MMSLRAPRHLPFISIVLTLLGVAAANAQALFDLRTDRPQPHPFDLLDVAIDVHFDLGEERVTGSVVHRIKLTAPSVRSIELDADSSLEIARVAVDGARADFRLTDSKLRITLPPGIVPESTHDVRVDYSVVPSRGLYFVAPDSVAPNRLRQIWTQGEARNHHFWVPIYDYPDDKATTGVRATVPASWDVLSNGSLVEHTINADGSASWRYRLDTPHSTYLIALVAGEFLVTRDTAAGIPLAYWSDPRHPERVAPTFASTGEILRFFEKKLGVPFPWGSYSQALVANFMFGGMENTTATVLNDGILTDRRWLVDYRPERVIAHEAAHQWFGDLITNASWRDLWIHESFATFLASEYTGSRFGEEALDAELDDSRQTAIELDSVAGRDPIVGGKGLVGTLYDRGALVLRMLKEQIGDDAFWRACRLLLQEHAYGSAATNDVQHAFERASGRDLGWFFDQWISHAGMPILTVSSAGEGNSLTITIDQSQKRDSLTGLFEVPLQIAISVRGSVRLIDTVLRTESLVITTNVDGPLDYVIADPARKLLTRIIQERSAGQLIAQLGAPWRLARLDAARELASVDTSERRDPVRARALARAYATESSTLVREAIVQSIARFDAPEAADVIVTAMADSAADVRRTAASYALRIGDLERASRSLRGMLNDSSLAVVGSALASLAAVDTSGLIPILRHWRGVESHGDVVARGWIDAVVAGKLKTLVDDVARLGELPSRRSTRWQALAALASIDTTTDEVRRAITNGLLDRSAMIREVAVEAMRAHQDSVMRASVSAALDRIEDRTRTEVEALLKAQ